jgi:hypothetical protein
MRREETVPGRASAEDAAAEETSMDEGKDVPVCRRLRTKMYFVLGRDHVDLREASPTGQYWCSRTATVLGPDDVYCSPQVCQPHRACFEPID